MLPDGLIRPAREWALCLVEPTADRSRYRFTYSLHGYEEVAELVAEAAALKPYLDRALAALAAAGWRLVNYDDVGNLYYEAAPPITRSN